MVLGEPDDVDAEPVGQLRLGERLADDVAVASAAAKLTGST